MRCKYVLDEHNLRTQDDNSTVQTIPPFDNILHSTAERSAMADLLTVLSFTDILNQGNWTTHWLDMLRMGMESLVEVQNQFQSIWGRSVASQGEIYIQYVICIVYEKWVGNWSRILGRCWQTHSTPFDWCCWPTRGTRWVCDLGNCRDRWCKMWWWIHEVCWLC